MFPSVVSVMTEERSHGPERARGLLTQHQEIPLFMGPGSWGPRGGGPDGMSNRNRPRAVGLMYEALP